MLVRFICWLLKGKRLSPQERMDLTELVLTKIDYLPSRAIITVRNEVIFINEVPLDNEKAYVVREAANSALKNAALKAVHDQVLYLAVSLGVHQAQTTEQIQFAKAAIWYGQQERELLNTLATLGTSELHGLED